MYSNGFLWKMVLHFRSDFNGQFNFFHQPGFDIGKTIVWMFFVDEKKEDTTAFLNVRSDNNRKHILFSAFVRVAANVDFI